MRNKSFNKTAEAIYNRANYFGIELEATCVSISQSQWDNLMENAKRADKRKVDKLVKKWAEENEEHDLLNIVTAPYQPYKPYKTDTHIIFIHSGIEHFFRIKS